MERYCLLLRAPALAMLLALATASAVLGTVASGAIAATMAPSLNSRSPSEPATQPPERDLQFIDMMVPHHEGAVEMARIAQLRAERPEIRELAAAIIDSQSAEISQMKAWRLAWYGSDQTPPMSVMPMLHDTPAMAGGAMTMTMNMAQDVEQLRAAPEPFDRAFIDAMIPHHQSAIDAAVLAQRQAVHREIRDLALAIVEDQQREIQQMRLWRFAWYGPDPSERPLEPPMPGVMPGMEH